MAYKNLLVHLDESAESEKRADAAIAFAQAQDAHLTALGVVVEASIPNYVRAQVPADVLQTRHREAKERTEAFLAAFEAKAGSAGLRSETRIETCLQPDVTRCLSRHARYADLLILGQKSPETASLLGGAPQAEDVLLSSGRPVLVVPYIGAAQTLGERVVIAWDAGREAARAVNDSLPILKRAKDVAVVTINARSSEDGHGEEPGADIALHLARHGCQVAVEHLESRDIGIGDTLLSHLADRGADLLVMGAYGHARLRELVLGGATRHLLQHMTVPVLMSH